MDPGARSEFQVELPESELTQLPPSAPLPELDLETQSEDLPSGWQSVTSPSGQVVYINDQLGLSQYERPLPPVIPTWRKVITPSGRVVYVNDALGLAQYENPDPSSSPMR